MKVLLFGASGMIGAGVLLECLDDDRVTSVTAVGRSPSGISHPKLRELIRSDVAELRDVREEVAGHDACFFCLGVSSAGMDEAEYHRITYGITRGVADALIEYGPPAIFCYISGEGTDSTEVGRTMWARVKGKTENYLLRSPLDAYMFRPGYIQPLRGVRSRTPLYQTLYIILRPLYPLLRRVAPTHVTTSVNVGRAMIEVAAEGYPKRILENPDINALASRSKTISGAER